MKHLRYILPILAFFIAVTGCNKAAIESSPVKPIDTDMFIHQISFAAPIQYTGVNVNGNIVSLTYNENVNVFLPKEGYELSYAVHLKEDFTTSALESFTFTTPDTQGKVTTDWVDDNLNEIAAKTVKDTTLNNIAMVKITVKRPFNFTKTFANNQAALNEQDYLSKLLSDKINFSSYVYFTKTYPATALHWFIKKIIKLRIYLWDKLKIYHFINSGDFFYNFLWQVFINNINFYLISFDCIDI